MNWKNRNSILFFLAAILLVACDTFEEDTLRTGDEEFQLRSAFSTTPNTDFFLDLKTTINTGEVVRFSLNDLPSKGDASINDEAILHYKPFSDFVSGTDILTIDLYNLNGVLLDTDSIEITMTDSANIACFNGALPDYYAISKNNHLLFDATVNDGFCKDQLKAFNIAFATPIHGEVSKVQDSETEYVYIPEPDFFGVDSFRYELTMVDLNDKVYESISSVRVEVIDANGPTGCDSLLLPMYFEIPEGQEYIDVLPYRPQPACDVINYEFEITWLSAGQVEIIDDKLIRYFPNGADIGILEYHFSALDIVNGRNTITFQVAGNQDSTACAEAFDDQYYFDLQADSIASGPFRMYPFENDEYCTQSFYIEILEAPSFGRAYISDEKYLDMIVQEEFNGPKSTRIKYQLCEGDECDFAFIELTVEK